MYVSTCDSASTISPGCLELKSDYFLDPVSPPLSSAYPALFALVLTSSPPACGLISPALIFPSMQPNAHSPKCCGGSEGIIDFDRCRLFSKLSLEDALNMWKA